MAPSPRDRFRARLLSGPFILDGACGTELMRQGLPAGEAPERWVLERPAPIRELASAYAAAGANAVYTCTFGANRVRLGRGGLAGRTAEIAARAVALAREGVAAPHPARRPTEGGATGGGGSRALVFGDLGPTGEWLDPVGEMTEDEAREAFGELARALVAAGVDALIAETFTDPREAVLAVEAARAAAPGLPVLATMSFEGAAQGHRTATGATPEIAAAKLMAAGADAIGINCGLGPAEAGAVAARMHAAVPDAPLIVKPNAGLPRLEEGRAVYAVGPEEFSGAMAALRGLGVGIFGGCCGTSPAHLRALAQALAAG